MEKNTGLHDPEETQLNNGTALVESPEENRVSDRGYEDRITPKELKEQISFVRLLQLDKHKVISGGKSKKCLCPFHDERTASFYVREDDSTAKCYGCGWYGDIFDYVMEHRELDFGEAFKYIEKRANQIKRTKPFRASGKPAPKPATLSKDELKTQQEAAEKLAEGDHLQVSVASQRGWEPSTIQKLAEEGSLGWNQGALAFLYDTGMKLRDWPHRKFVWEFGGPCVWRRNRCKETTEIFICEGETDAISLIDKGLEDDPDIAVIALASATLITGDLVDLVRGKNVTLCMDDDEAGHKATEKLIELLEPVCASVQTLNVGGIA